MGARTVAGRTLLIVVLVGLVISPGAVSGQSSAAPAEVGAVAFCDSVTQIPKAECQALVDLYDSASGAFWADNTGWLATTTPCSTPWYGVACGGGHVTVLSLSSNGLSGSIPSSLDDLSNLQLLRLGFNHLTGSIPASLGNLSSLERLSLVDNSLTGSIPSSLGNLSSLESLDLGDNELSGSIPSSLGNLPNLQVLALYYNSLTGSIPSSLGNLSALAALYLQNNDLTGSIPSSLGNLSSLEELYLGSNSLAGGVPFSLGNLLSLRYLDVASNPLSGALPSSLTNLNPVGFYFSNTNLCEPPDAAFQAWLAGIPNLRRTSVLCTSVALQGYVRAGQGGAGIEGAWITLRHKVGTDWPACAAGPTDADGHFSLSCSTSARDFRLIRENPEGCTSTGVDVPAYATAIDYDTVEFNLPDGVTAGATTFYATCGLPPPPSGCWDADRIAAPRVLAVAGKYRMWYDGMQRTESGNVWGIGLAESPDGVHWSKYTGNPVLGAGDAGEWDSLGRIQAAVINDGGTYRMWFTGSDGSVWQTGYATSPDGIAWTVHPGNPVLAVGGPGSWEEQETNAHAVIKEGSTYKMWYHGCNLGYESCSIGFAASLSGSEWLKHPGNPVFSGTPGDWDEGFVAWPAVIKNGDTYEMWYSSHGKIGHATSSDGIQWVKDASNPVLSAGQFGTNVWQPTVLLEGGTYKMWYRQGPATDSSIGYAESSDGTHWTLWPRGTVLVPCEQYEMYLPVVMRQ